MTLHKSWNSGETFDVKKAFNNILIELAEKDDRIIVLDADLMRCCGTEVFAQRFPERHIQVGVAEQNMIGIAAGFALSGFIPFANSFANFIAKRACDQHSISVAYNRTNVKIVGTYAGLTSATNGGSHISVADIAIFRSIPGYVVISPGDTFELEKVTRKVAYTEGAVYIQKVRGPMPRILDEDYKFEIGKSVELMKGADVTIVPTGVMTYYALLAAEELKKKDISAGVLHMPTIKPIDRKALVRASEKTHGIVTVENHNVYGGLGSAVTEVLAEENPTKVRRIGIPDKFGETGLFEWQLSHFGMDVNAIVSAAQEIIR